MGVKTVAELPQHTGHNNNKNEMTMFGFFSKERREERLKLRELHTFSKTFGTLERLEQSGMLWFDMRNRRLMIEQPLAVLMMKDAESWMNFMRNVFQWQYYKQCNKAWEEYIQTEELRSVRAAIKEAAAEKPSRQLNYKDIDRIKRARRDEIAFDEVKAPKVEGFEFFVVREAATGTQQTGHGATKTESVPGGEIRVVGNYDPQKDDIEMAAWEEVKQFIVHNS